jgi:hypothetical protein
VCPVAIIRVLEDRLSEVSVAEQDDVVGSALPAGGTGEKIVTVITADSGWRAIYGNQGGEDSGLSRVVAWALVENDAGERQVVGMVVDPQDRSSIVTATGTESAQAGTLTGYGYKER